MIFTTEGLAELTNLLKEREKKCNLRKINKDRYVKDDPTVGIEIKFDVTKELDIKTKSLQNYFEKEKEYLNKYEGIRQKEIAVIANKDKEKKVRTERKKKESEFRKDRKQKRLKDKNLRETLTKEKVGEKEKIEIEDKDE